MTNCCVTFIVYFVIFCNIIGGVCQLFGLTTKRNSHNYDKQRPYTITAGFFSILMGAILLIGVLKRNITLVKVYLIVKSIGLIFISIGDIWLTTAFAEETQTIFYGVCVLLLAWLLQYCIYLYYKELIETKETMKRALRRDATVENPQDLLNATA